jgi:hypothetical protein
MQAATTPIGVSSGFVLTPKLIITGPVTCSVNAVPLSKFVDSMVLENRLFPESSDMLPQVVRVGP